MGRAQRPAANCEGKPPRCRLALLKIPGARATCFCSRFRTSAPVTCTSPPAQLKALRDHLVPVTPLGWLKSYTSLGWMSSCQNESCTTATAFGWTPISTSGHHEKRLQVSGYTSLEPIFLPLYPILIKFVSAYAKSRAHFQFTISILLALFNVTKWQDWNYDCK